MKTCYILNTLLRPLSTLSFQQFRKVCIFIYTWVSWYQGWPLTRQHFWNTWKWAFWTFWFYRSEAPSPEAMTLPPATLENMDPLRPLGLVQWWLILASHIVRPYFAHLSLSLGFRETRMVQLDLFLLAKRVHWVLQLSHLFLAQSSWERPLNVLLSLSLLSSCIFTV